MELFFLFCGALGAWLLVAGPLYQAALELRDEDIEVDRIHAAGKNVTILPRVSAWWWLLPPVKIILERRRSHAYRRDFIRALSQQDLDALVSFINKATAWMFVAIGGFLIATKETYELCHELDVPVAWFWVIVLVMLLLSIINTVARIHRSKDMLSTHIKD